MLKFTCIFIIFSFFSYSEDLILGTTVEIQGQTSTISQTNAKPDADTISEIHIWTIRIPNTSPHYFTGCVQCKLISVNSICSTLKLVCNNQSEYFPCIKSDSRELCSYFYPPRKVIHCKNENNRVLLNNPKSWHFCFYVLLSLLSL